MRGKNGGTVEIVFDPAAYQAVLEEKGWGLK